MSSEKINEALESIDKSGLERPYLNNKFSVSSQEVQEAETKIGSKFPKSYNEFLEKLGSGDFQGEEFYGLIPSQLDVEEIPNGLWFTLDMQENMDLPKELFAFQDFDGDAVACLMLSQMKDGECPVILWDHSENHQRQLSKPHVLADSFGCYFLKKVQELLEDEGLR